MDASPGLLDRVPVLRGRTAWDEHLGDAVVSASVGPGSYHPTG